MKKVLLIAAAAAVIACNTTDREPRNSVQELRTYVDSVKKDRVDYQDEAYWENVDRGYEEKRQRVDAKIAHGDAQLRKEYEDLQRDYAELKARYMAEKDKARQHNDRKIVLRNSLFGEGVIGEDMNFSFMTATNAARTYEYFVNTVNEHSDEYSREDWDEIKVLYEAMDTRKNEIEKDLSGKDNLKIAGLKVKFGAIKSVNRPFSKMEENSEAKDRGGK